MFQCLLGIIYLAFISLGLPDALLGSAWPTIYQEFAVPVSYSGGIFMIIAGGTIISSLLSDRLTRRFGTGAVTVVSVLTTAIALFGFSVSHSYLALCLWAIPYGLGAGSVDASLNNYVALHYASRHMSWLHCMWGIGASVGPYIMGYALTGGQGWNMGYRLIAAFQVILTAVLVFSLPLWNRRHEARGREEKGEIGCLNEPLSFKKIWLIPGAREVMITFFCYCALEQTASLWAGSYLVLNRGFSEEQAAAFAGLYFAGITIGRFAGGFLTMRYGDDQMIRLGNGGIFAGILLLLLPFGKGTALLGLLLTGLGCAPIYPAVIHATPENFGKDRSQAMIGVQMAAAYLGTCLMPPVFGVIANKIQISMFPVYLLLILAVMAVMYEKMCVKIKSTKV